MMSVIVSHSLISRKIRRGFTLIELLVVIAIIAVLAAILFPVFSQARLAAKATASISNLKQLSIGKLLYSADVDDMTVPAATWQSGADPIQLANGKTMSTWVWLMQPYVKSTDVFYDPMGPAKLTFRGIPDTVATSVRHSYGYNQVYMSYWDGTGAPSKTISTSSVGSASKTIVFGTKTHPAEMGNATLRSTPFGNIYYGSAAYSNPTLDAGPNVVTIIDPPAWDEVNYPVANSWGEQGGANRIQGFELGRVTGRLTFRKSKKAIVSFLDGHVATLSAGALSAGTNFDLESNLNPPEDYEFPIATITDKEAYLWDIE